MPGEFEFLYGCFFFFSFFLLFLSSCLFLCNKKWKCDSFPFNTVILCWSWWFVFAGKKYVIVHTGTHFPQRYHGNVCLSGRGDKMVLLFNSSPISSFHCTFRCLLRFCLQAFVEFILLKKMYRPFTCWNIQLRRH